MRTRVLLFVFFVAFGVVAKAQTQPMPDTAGLKILLAGHESGILPKDDFIKSPVFTTSNAELGIAAYTIGAAFKGGDYLGPVEVKGNGLPTVMNHLFNPFGWQQIFVSDIVLEYHGKQFPFMKQLYWSVK